MNVAVSFCAERSGVAESRVSRAPRHGPCDYAQGDGGYAQGDGGYAQNDAEDAVIPHVSSCAKSQDLESISGTAK